VSLGVKAVARAWRAGCRRSLLRRLSVVFTCRSYGCRFVGSKNRTHSGDRPYVRPAPVRW